VKRRGEQRSISNEEIVYTYKINEDPDQEAFVKATSIVSSTRKFLWG
jgi:hypothetical protein